MIKKNQLNICKNPCSAHYCPDKHLWMCRSLVPGCQRTQLSNSLWCNCRWESKFVGFIFASLWLGDLLSQHVLI